MPLKWVGIAAVVAALGALAVAPVAAAHHLPYAFARAQQGPLVVESDIVVWHKSVELFGSWTREDLECEGWRRLRVRVEIERIRLDFVVPPDGRRVFVRRGVAPNCVPGVGFAKSAYGLGMACPDGAWKPGRYSMGITTLHFATGVRARGSLNFAVARGC